MATATRAQHSKIDKVQINQGLDIVYSGTEKSRKSPGNDTVVDIVAVPGLGANPEYTWITQKVDWIRDGNMLQRTVENARIMVFEYESQWFGNGSIDQSLPTVATQLLQSLKHIRQRTKTTKRPIIFVCHCLGGIVVEKAILTAKLHATEYDNMLMFLAGCVFLATPFRGTKSQKKAAVVAKMSQAVGVGTESSLVKLLADDSETLRDLLQDFSILARDTNMRLFCFFEQHKSNLTKLLPKQPFFKEEEIIVDEESAGILGYNKLGLAADHFQMNKFPSPKDGRYVAVSSEISAIAQSAPGILKKRQNAQRESLIDPKIYQAKLEELRATDPKKDMEDSVKGRPTSQASWILSNGQYAQWEAAKSSQTLWVHGNAGKGQAVVACSVIERLTSQQLREDGVFVAYFFCDEKDANRRSTLDILKLLIRQMILQEPNLTEHLLVDSHRTGSSAQKSQKHNDVTVPALWSSLQNILSDPSVRKVYFVINSLDEAELPSREEFLPLLAPYLGVSPDTVNDPKYSVVKWMFLSRSGRQDISKNLNQSIIVNMEDKENSVKVNSAVKAEISSQVDALAKLKDYNSGLAYFIKKHITSRAEGSYIYVSLVIQELKNLDATQMSMTGIRKQLEEFPPGLNDMFGYIRRRVLDPKNQSIETTKEILRALILAERAPNLFELAVMADLPTQQRNDEAALRICVAKCGAFVTVSDDEYQIVSFIDVAAREYLEAEAKDELSLSMDDMQNGIIALRCLDYVRSFYMPKDEQSGAETAENSEEPQDTSTDVGQSEGEETAPTGSNETSTEQNVSESTSPLEYPCKFWLQHAKRSDPDLVEEFDLSDPFWAEESASRDAWWSNYGGSGGYSELTKTTPMHISASSSYSVFLDYLIDQGHTSDIHKVDSWSYQPLHWACYSGDFDLMQRLVKAGAKVNTRAEGSDTEVLWLAAYNSRADIVEYLLSQGAEINARDEIRGTPLYQASLNGCLEVVKLLLSRKADVNITGGNYWRPINAAAYSGHEEIVGLLLRQNIEVDPDEGYENGNAVDYSRNALAAAARKGHSNIVRLLLQKGWKVDRKIKKYDSVLVLCAAYGHTDVARTILNYRIDIRSQQSALEIAAKNGKDEVVKAILERSRSLPHEKAFMNAAAFGHNQILVMLQRLGTNREMLSKALYQAADYQYESTVNLLLEFGADPNAEGEEYGTALIAAVWDRSEGIVQKLLDKKANVNKSNVIYGSPLHVAASWGHLGLVQILLAHGASVNTKTMGPYGSVLQAACHSGNAGIIELLLKHGTEVNARGGQYGCPIIAATIQAPDDSVKLLVQHGASVNSKNAEGDPLLVVGGYNLQKETMAFLLDHGAQINAESPNGNTALITTADSVDAEGVKLLLERGADIDANGPDGTALHVAAAQGDEDCLRVLICRDNGARVNVVSGRWHTPLQAAAHAADLDCITELLKAGADPQKSTPGGYYGSPLAAAAYSGNLECLKSLLDADAGAQVDQIGGEFGFPLQAAAIGGNIECLKTLLEIANVNARGGKYDSAIQAAASQADGYERVKLLIEHKADLLRTGGEYGSVMQATAIGGNVDSWNLLVDHGADMYVVEGKYGTACQASALKGRDNMITPLLNCQGERDAVNARGGKYETPLQAAAFADRHDIVTTLLEHGANASAQGGYYGSALTAAAIRNCPDLLALILDQPLPDSMLDHAFLQAVMHRKEQAIDLLLKSGASVEARDKAHRSAWNLLDIDAIADDNSDIGDDFISDESQTAEESRDSGDNVVSETDTSAADDTDDDASKASLELGETVTEQSRILKMLNEAKAQLKKHPGQQRIYPANHKVYHEDQATTGAPQAGSTQRNGTARRFQTSKAGSLTQFGGAPNSLPLYANSGSQDFAGGNPSPPASSGLFSTISKFGKSFHGQGDTTGSASNSPTTAQHGNLSPSAPRQTRNLPFREPEAEQTSNTYDSSYGQRTSNDHQSGSNAYNANRQQGEVDEGPRLNGGYINNKSVSTDQPTETSRYASNTDEYGNANQPSNNYQPQRNDPQISHYDNTQGDHPVDRDPSDDEPDRVVQETKEESDNDGEVEHSDQEEDEDDNHDSRRLAAPDDDDDGQYNPAQNEQAESEEDNDDQDESEANNDTQSEAPAQDTDDDPQAGYKQNYNQTSENDEPDDTDEQDADVQQEPEDDDDEPSTSHQPQEDDDEPSTSYHQPQDEDDDDNEPEQQTYTTTNNNNNNNNYEPPPQQSSSTYDGAEAVDAALQKAKEKAKKLKFWK